MHLTTCTDKNGRMCHMHIVFDAPDVAEATALTAALWPDFVIYGDELNTPWARDLVLGSQPMGAALVYKRARSVDVTLTINGDIEDFAIERTLAGIPGVHSAKIMGSPE